MGINKTTGTVFMVPVFYAVLCVGRVLGLLRTSFYDSVCCFVFFFGVNKKKHIHVARTPAPSAICRRAVKSGLSDRLHCLGKVKFVHCFSVTKIDSSFLPVISDHCIPHLVMDSEVVLSGSSKNTFPFHSGFFHNAS